MLITAYKVCHTEHLGEGKVGTGKENRTRRRNLTDTLRWKNPIEFHQSLTGVLGGISSVEETFLCRLSFQALVAFLFY